MLKRRNLFRFLNCLALLLPMQGRAQNSSDTVTTQATPSNLSFTQQQIDTLADDPQWKKLLYYMDTWFLGERSLVDDGSFFFSEHGHSDPRGELSATLNAFTTGTDVQKQNAYCQFPARKAWLEQKLDTQFIEPLPELESEICKRNKIFQTSVKAHKASLIFSSYFPGNPGSLFGHTLIKFTKTSKTGAATSDLLDYGLNHAAHPTTANPLLYAIMGLSGFFPGYISLMPYYIKVQEYNNAESRDLWEYELSLTPNEVKLALLSVFELSTRRVDYYYFDDNCSLIMLAVLDVARPSLNLVDKFDAWVIPGDTVRVLNEQAGLVSKIKFRPSNVRRYLSLEKELTQVERTHFNSVAKQLKNKELDLATLDGLNQQQRVRVLDTLTEYIDAVEQVSASKEPEKWKNEREELLNARAQIKLISKEVHIEAPFDEAPHSAYPPTRFTAGQIWSRSSGSSTHRTGALLGWRPALHSLDNPTAGMGAELGITFFNFDTMISAGKFHLREFTPLKIETLTVNKPHISSTSWSFALKYEQQCFAGCALVGIDGSLGKAWPFLSEKSRFALRTTLETGYAFSKGASIEPGVAAQLNFPLSNSVRWMSAGGVSRNYTHNQRGAERLHAKTSVVVRPLLPFEISLNYQIRNKEHQSSAVVHWYF